MSSHDEHDQIMTLSETAAYLKVAERTLLRMVHAGEIPCAKVGGQWRFVRSVIDDWLLSRMSMAGGASGGGRSAGERGSPTEAGEGATGAGTTGPVHSPFYPAYRLSRFLHEQRVQLDLPGGLHKRDVLERLARPLSSDGVVTDRARFVSLLLEREAMVSTAVAHHVAIPHIRRPDPELIRGAGISVGVCPEGTDFDALDGEATYLFVLLAAESEDLHLTLLAQCGAMLRDPATVRNLRAAAHPADVLRHVIEADYRMLLSNR